LVGMQRGSFTRPAWTDGLENRNSAPGVEKAFK